MSLGGGMSKHTSRMREEGQLMKPWFRQMVPLPSKFQPLTCSNACGLADRQPTTAKPDRRVRGQDVAWVGRARQRTNDRPTPPTATVPHVSLLG